MMHRNEEDFGEEFVEIEDGAEEVDESEGFQELFPGDRGSLPFATREVLVTLLRGPYLYQQEQSRQWDVLMRSRGQIKAFLSEIFLELIIDEEIGVAFLRQVRSEEQKIPTLLNHYRYNFLDSVLLIEMRESLMRNLQTGQRATISTDEIFGHLRYFDPDSQKDEPAFKRRVEAVIKRFKERRLLIPLGRSGIHNSYEISPVLKVIFGADQIEVMKANYESLMKREVSLASLDKE